MDALASPISTRPRRATALLRRHAAQFGPLVVLSVITFLLAAHRARTGLPVPVRAAYGLLVAFALLSLVMSSWCTMLGGAAMLWQRLRSRSFGPTIASPTGRSRSAVLLPICEEDTARVFAAAEVIAADLAAYKTGPIDIFLLSDTRSAECAAEEERLSACVDRPGRPSIFYRRRVVNKGRKAGNIADFVTRWGSGYDYMVVLDADSLMTGKAIDRLIGAMDANPRAGIIQSMCFPVGRRTLFARFHQFNARLYGPLFQHGAAFWQARHGNYWGHNAIIRVKAFANSCGLPELPGPYPFGGEILSHDTVEAALMVRAGYDVWMLPDGDPDDGVGSWEETPTNLLDYLDRDRRWCRGNLQHFKVLSASDLRAASLYHLVRGLFHYLYAPLIAAWVLAYLFVDRTAKIDALCLVTVGLVVLPRLLCLTLAIIDRRENRGFGGTSYLLGGALLELLLTALIYPVTLVFHLYFLIAACLGKESGWSGQARHERGVRWGEATERLFGPVGIGLVAVALMAIVSPLPVLLFGPGLVLSIPLAVVVSRRMTDAGDLFQTPEDTLSERLREQLGERETDLATALSSSLSGTQAVLPSPAGLLMPTQVLCRRAVRQRAAI